MWVIFNVNDILPKDADKKYERLCPIAASSRV
jgi:hypothetical protein